MATDAFAEARRAVVDGDLPTLAGLLARSPELATARGPRRGATLLHYVAANGVEDDLADPHARTPDPPAGRRSRKITVDSLAPN